MDRIEERGGAIEIGALVSLSDLETSGIIREKLPLLAEAAGEAASPQLRNMGTVAGNILQRPRCWYYRDAKVPCLRKGGERCYAVAGDNRYHAILGGGPCHIVCPSDLAPALTALGGEAVVVGAENGKTAESTVPLTELFVGPKDNPHRENILAPGQVVRAVRVPVPAAGARGVFLKAAERRVWDFALSSVAAQLVLEGDGTVTSASIVLGGVAPNPWVSREAAEAITGGPLSDERCQAAAEAAVGPARPMRHNAYKVELTRNLVRRALRGLRG
jgi:xanthine dehydrogenase YagS FAD-binding subunit